MGTNGPPSSNLAAPPLPHRRVGPGGCLTLAGLHLSALFFAADDADSASSKQAPAAGPRRGGDALMGSGNAGAARGAARGAAATGLAAAATARTAAGCRSRSSSRAGTSSSTSSARAAR